MCELYLNQGVKKKKRMNWMLVTHSRHPSDSGGRDQEDCGSKPAWTNSLKDPASKNHSQTRAGGVA
jgi:hypothetical protein